MKISSASGERVGSQMSYTCVGGQSESQFDVEFNQYLCYDDNEVPRRASPSAAHLAAASLECLSIYA